MACLLFYAGDVPTATSYKFIALLSLFALRCLEEKMSKLEQSPRRRSKDL